MKRGFIRCVILKQENGMTPSKRWSRVEYLHESVRNPNIHIRGTNSYYSDAWSGSFERSVGALPVWR